MESMKEVRNWLVTKCRIPSAHTNFLQLPKDQVQNYGSVVTPQNIPEFIIPKSSSDGSSHADSGDIVSTEDDFDSHNSVSPPDSRHTSPRHSPRSSFLGLSNDFARCTSKSAPTSPYTAPPPFRTIDVISCEDLQELRIKDTNADPHSLAAMSLPHFRTKTNFGFTTLNQSPHTRRKESLFHCDPDAISPALFHRQSKRRNNTMDGSKGKESVMRLSPSPPPTEPLEDDAFPLHRRGSRRREPPSTVVTPITILTCQRCSPDSSPLPSPDSSNCPPYLMQTNGASLSPYHLSPGMANTNKQSRRNRLYYRRRSSLPGFEEDQTESTDADSLQVKPEGRRKSHETLQAPTDNSYRKRHSSPCATEAEEIQISHISTSRSCSYVDKNNTFHSHMLAEFGELKFSFQSIAQKRQFKVVLIKAENLGGRNKTDQNINSYAKIYLMPGKIQKHTSETVKHTRDPIYNQEFIFNDIAVEELCAMKLRIKIFHRGQHFSRHVFIGEVVVLLEKYNICSEQRMWKDLEPKMDSEELGYLQCSVNFDPKAGRLEAMVIQAKDLPKHHITGAPDPYVKVEITQPGKSEMKKQTRIRKKTTQPLFKESFSFAISPKLEDLNYTAVTFTVYDHDRIRSDDVIGQVRLGYGATEETELDQWNEVLQLPGQEVIKWHYLMELDDDV